MSELAFPDLEFPEVADEVVDAAPPSASAPAAPVMSKEVALATIKTTALAELTAVGKGIAELRTTHGSTDYDITTPKGMALATARRLAVRTVRYKVPHVVKARKAELKDISDALVAEGDRITAELKAIEDTHDALITAEETRRANEKAERERLAAERKAGFDARIAGIRACVAKCQGITSARIADGIAKVESIPVDASGWEEFATEAALAKTETLDAMRSLYTSTKAAEDIEAAAAEERARLELVAKQQAEESARLKKVADDLAAEQQKARDELAAQQAAFADKVAAFEASQRKAAEPVPVAIDPVGESAPATYIDDDGVITNTATGQPVQTLDEGAPIALSSEVAGILDAGRQEVLQAFAPATLTPAIAPTPAAPLNPVPAGPNFNAGNLAARLGFSLTVDFIEKTLGVQHCSTMKSSTYWRASDFPVICDALIAHLTKAKATA